jgi:metallo-beta-lactamase family protein
MQIEFVGAAQTVTGSKHLVRSKSARVLLDCGLVQGRRKESVRANQDLGVAARELDAVVLSHAHIDHSGALPILVKKGYDGPIYVTPATRDLCAAMLEDAARIQEQDARYINKLVDRGEADLERVEALYSGDDVVRVLERMVSVPYGRKVPIADGAHLTLLDAGHVLGSAIVVLDIDEEGKKKRVAFTGDLGRRRMPILRDPEIPSDVDALVTESTYGDRLHKPIQEMDDELAGIIKRTYERGGKVIIPSFALERAQEILYALRMLKSEGKLPKIPVYVDSPLTVKITDIFKLHPECYDAETRQLIQSEKSPFELEEMHYVSEKEESKAIDASREPCVIISASGMCEAGRVVHHLKASIESEKNTVIIVGYQAQHTLGRRLVERRPRVRIFGVERDLRAEVVVLNGFSAHADQKDLLSFADDVKKRGPGLPHVALVHGDPPAQKVLAEMMGGRGIRDVRIPAPGDAMTV